MMDAAEIIREARRRAGLLQRELGALAGLPQSAVSAYESGRVQPSVPVIRRLVEAVGFELDLSLRAAAPAPPAFVGPKGRLLQRHRARLRGWLLDQGFGRPEVFGSVARGDDTNDSDIDLLVDIPTGIGLVRLAGARREASKFVGAPVDLVPREGLKPVVAEMIAADLVPL